MIFTQFLHPDGRAKPESIDMSPEIEALASELRAAGWSFEIECFPDTQLVNADCCDDEGTLAVELCRNGPGVPAMVERLVRKAHKTWVDNGRAPAEGNRLGKLEARIQRSQMDVL